MDDWYTPARYLDLAREVLGTITLDPFSSDTANSTVKADRYFTADRSALDRPWGTGLSVWANPPFSFPLIEKCVDALLDHRGDITQAIVLTNLVVATGWAKRLWSASDAVLLCDHRIPFELAPGKPGPKPRHEQMFYYLGSDVDRFAEAFGAIGTVIYLQ